MKDQYLDSVESLTLNTHKLSNSHLSNSYLLKSQHHSPTDHSAIKGTRPTTEQQSKNSKTANKLTKNLLSISTIVTLSLCVSIIGLNESHANISRTAFLQSYANASNIKSEHIPIIYHAEQNSSPAGRAVLAKARTMSLEQRAIVKGSCWDYLNAIFKRAKVKRNTVFKGTKHGGKYYNVNNIQAGDWLYYINHSYHGIEHSGMFIGWVNKAKNEALILSYAGGNRSEPARYKVYDISNVYNVMRPIMTNATPAPTARAKSNQNFLASNNNRSHSVRHTQASNTGSLNNPQPQQKTFHHQQATYQSNQGAIQPTQPPVRSSSSSNSLQSFIKSYQNVNNIKSVHIPILHQAEYTSYPAGSSILRQGRVMTLDNQEIIAGSSRNYVKSVFERANMKYQNVFVGDYHGNFIHPHHIQAGDWLSYINHSYNQAEHTGIFVGWTDKPRNQALILSYGGENRRHPARYRVYDISNIYHVRRPVF